MARPVVMVTTDRRSLGPAPAVVDRVRPARAEVFVGEVVVQRLRAAGAAVALLPPGDPAGGEELLDRADALVITGGAFDIHPRHYGQRVAARLDRVDEDRTSLELALCRRAVERGMPVLGICGGMQVMAVALGGTLHQHVEGHEQRTDPVEAWHALVPEPNAPAELLSLVGPDSNSTHHQAVDALGPLAVLARAPDGVVEAVYLPGARFCVGVQGHPELRSDACFEALVRAAAALSR